MDSASLLVQMEKMIRFGWHHNGDMFSSFWPRLPSPRYQPRAIFWLKHFLESRLSSKSLEPLIGLLAYLELKLWVKNQKLVKILSYKC